MQISKVFLTCGAVLCFVVVAARAADTAADAQLREALRQKIAERALLESAPAAPTAPVTSAPVAPAPVTPPPVAPDPVTPAPVAPAPVTPPPVAEPVVIAPEVVAPELAPAFPAMPAPTVEDDAQTARLREALRARVAEENAKTAAAAPEIVTQGSDLVPAVSTTTVTSPQTDKPTKATVTAAPAPVPMVAPPLPISGSKAERLAQLLQQYKADQISPEEYHQQRARILAE